MTLEASPVRGPLSRVEIRRRAQGNARNVSEFLGGDHRRLDAILSAVEGLVESGAFAGAAPRFAEFAYGLSRHIAMKEERVLYPLLDRMAGGDRERDDLVRKMQAV